MPAPILRRFTRALPLALDAFLFSTDDQSTLTQWRVNTPNTILDLVNDPDPAAGLRYQIDAFKNTLPTGRSFFTTAMSSASAGRPNLGPITVSGNVTADLGFSVAQRAGALTATSFLVKMERP